MRTDALTLEDTAPSTRGLHLTLWVAQLALAAMFLMAGGIKTFATPEVLAAKMPGMMTLPLGLVRFIGVSELLGASGLVLPAATRILPRLTALAAASLATVMLLAIGFHLARGESSAIPTNAVFGGIAAFVAWGRAAGAPIRPRR